MQNLSKHNDHSSNKLYTRQIGAEFLKHKGVSFPYNFHLSYLELHTHTQDLILHTQKLLEVANEKLHHGLIHTLQTLI